MSKAGIIIQHGPKTQIRVSEEEYNGKTFLSVRTWAMYGTPPEYGPTKKGVSIPLELAPKVAEAITEVLGAKPTATAKSRKAPYTISPDGAIGISCQSLADALAEKGNEGDRIWFLPAKSSPEKLRFWKDGRWAKTKGASE